MLAVAALTLAACRQQETPVAAPPGHPPEVQRAGTAFRATLLAQWKARPAAIYADFDDLCRATFVGLSLREANATMRAAGQVFDVVATRQPASLTPPDTIAFAGGLGLGADLISSAGFNIVLYVGTGTAGSAVVKHASCGIRSTYL